MEIELLRDYFEQGRDLPAPWKLQYFKEISDRVLWISGDIEDGTLDVIKKIQEWNKEDEELEEQERMAIKMPKNFKKPITLYFNSDGGDLEMSLAVATAVKNSAIPVYGHNIGTCASGAALIYSQCDVRTGEDTATFLIHKGGVSGMGGTFQQTKKTQMHYEWLVNKMMDMIYEGLGKGALSREEFDALADSEWYLYKHHENPSQDATLLGFINQ